LKAFDTVLKAAKQVRFLHFLMYFHFLNSKEDVWNIQFRIKKRSLQHVMASFGHKYLLKDLLKST